MASPSFAVLSVFDYRIRSSSVGTMKALILAWLLLIFANGITGGSAGSIATINTFDGHHLGPYIVKNFHSDAETEGAAAEALVGVEGSGDGADLDVDTEYGDDDPSGDLTTGGNEHNTESNLLSPPDATIPSLDENMSDAISNEKTTSATTTTQRSTTRKPSTTTTPTPSPSKTTQRSTTRKPSTTTTPTPSPSTTTTSKAPSTSRATSKAPPIIVPTQSPLTAANSSCHKSCQQLLHKASLVARPNVSFIEETETLGFSCAVNIGEENAQLLQNFSLHWVFEGGDPPQSGCALDEQKYLAQCEGFNARALPESNASSLMSHLVVQGLATHNTGYYKCQVHVDCCSNTLQHELTHHVTVWTADYTMLIAVTSSITVTLVLVVIAVPILKRRAQKKSNAHKSIPKKLSEADGKKTESHLPYVLIAPIDDCDSFTSSEDF